MLSSFTPTLTAGGPHGLLRLCSPVTKNWHILKNAHRNMKSVTEPQELFLNIDSTRTSDYFLEQLGAALPGRTVESQDGDLKKWG